MTTKVYILLVLYAHLQQEDSLCSFSTSVLDDKLKEVIGLSSISAKRNIYEMLLLIIEQLAET